MQTTPNEHTISSFKNPFDDYNANVLAPNLIMQYWCNPFNTGGLKDVDEKRFFTEKMPIILQGSRGTGKTTILKYCSFPVQCERAKQNSISIAEQIQNDSGIGFYLRCDDSFLEMFKTVFLLSVQDAWLSCFKHYVELFFSKNILDFLQTIEYTQYVPETEFITSLDLNKYLDTPFHTIDSLSQYINDEIKYLNKYKNEALFTRQTFSPIHFWDFYELSGALIQCIQSKIPIFKDTLFLLLIDEFENLPLELQKMFNTMIKFCKQGMSMRIGRRSENENIITKATVNSREYLREGNDYCLLVLDPPGQDIQDTKPYLLGIAEKRLAAFNGLKLPTDIKLILDSMEDWTSECIEVVSGRNYHMEYILTVNSRLSSNPELCQNIIDIISFPSNPIAEALNALWVSRASENEDLIEVAKDTVGAMHSFFEKGSHHLSDKYKNDYTNKYRYALTILIYAAYKKDKLYYSFNTVCYLSEGNTRTFINLCKSIISDALFYERLSFISTGKISRVSQNRAIREYSNSEFNSVCSIIKNGKSIKNLILKIGNVLSDYHKDRSVRYPETTQFVFIPEELDANSKETLDIAESWALINKRNDLQRLSAEVEQEGSLYSLNRIFSPLFNVSYRIRGGINIIFSAEEIQKMISGQQIVKLNPPPKKRRSKSPKKSPASNVEQISMFEGGES